MKYVLAVLALVASLNAAAAQPVATVANGPSFSRGGGIAQAATNPTWGIQPSGQTSGLTVTPTGGSAAVSLSDLAAKVATSLQPAAVNAPNGLAGLNGSGKVTAPVVGDVSDATTGGTAISTVAATAASASTAVSALAAKSVTSIGATSLASPATRPPTQYDDSSVGYIAGDLWQFGGKAWQATSVAPGAAVWAPLTVSGLPGDVAGTLFACGTRRVVTTYTTGPLEDITTTVSGAAKVTTVGQDANGNLNRAAMTAAIAAEDAGTFPTVTKCYNQVAGNAAGDAIGGPLPNSAIGGAPHGPHIGIVRLGAYDTMSWGQNNGPASLVIPGLTIPADHLFVGFLGRWHSTNTAQGVSPSLFSAGALSSANPQVQVLLGGSFDGRITVANYLSGATVEFPLSFDARPAASVVSFGNNDSVMASGRDVVKDSSLVSGGSVTGVSLGYISGDSTNNSGLAYVQSATADMALSAVVIAQQAPDQAYIDAFRANADVFMGYTPQARGEYVMLGDSRTAGANTYDGLSWTSFLTGPIAGFHQHNFAVSGATSAQMVSALPQALAMGRPGESKVMHIWIGINDRIQGVPVATTLANIQTMVSQAQAAGFRVAVQDETIGTIPSGGTTPDNLALRTSIKSQLDSGVIAADGQDDPFATGLPLADQSNVTFWNSTDHIHPYTDGHRVLGPFNAERDNTLVAGAN